MQFTTALLTAVLSATSLAAPAPIDARATQWTIKSLTRTCTAGTRGTCTWSFNISPTASAVVHCALTTVGDGTHDATKTNGGPVQCGRYSVSTGWSGQFGPGFTTMAVVDQSAKLIGYPSYTDAELAGGKAADKSRKRGVGVSGLINRRIDMHGIG
ncbi:uncharacterized protein BCR38DRAFT_421880 [Pseudomassariella vexata]|uniref:Small secreted protein n=1 Tax=Pseudomassariella vexata TaxID=1141098 RepID=A0A1Y2EFP4_9PEZI|nr:uncharacterized protein BCR38DRAFT_421880 [Pseudomassariella vexata]ORY70379.1 hypothetical protein BCR38DRAFT_421880 [Pseudomassariella vexata]